MARRHADVRCGAGALIEHDQVDVLAPQVFTCGPLPCMRHVRSTLLGRGIRANHIRYEVFGPDLWAAQSPAEPTTV